MQVLMGKFVLTIRFNFPLPGLQTIHRHKKSKVILQICKIMSANTFPILGDFDHKSFVIGGCYLTEENL